MTVKAIRDQILMADIYMMTASITRPSYSPPNITKSGLYGDNCLLMVSPHTGFTSSYGMLGDWSSGWVRLRLGGAHVGYRSDWLNS